MPDKLPDDNFVYFYHPDHLGSTGFVTDKDGELYEHNQYFPFGETWVTENSNTERLPYLFSSKELDQETGLYYFGARYYDPRTIQWTSPDPILGKYLHGEPNDGVYDSANLALYTYSYNNPLNFKDPDGTSPVVVIEIAKGFLQRLASTPAGQRAAQIAQRYGDKALNVARTQGAKALDFAKTQGGRLARATERVAARLGEKAQRQADASQRATQSGQGAAQAPNSGTAVKEAARGGA